MYLSNIQSDPIQSEVYVSFTIKPSSEQKKDLPMYGRECNTFYVKVFLELWETLVAGLVIKFSLRIIGSERNIINTAANHSSNAIVIANTVANPIN